MIFPYCSTYVKDAYIKCKLKFTRTPIEILNTYVPQVYSFSLIFSPE